MIAGELALVTAAIFTGAALYVSLVEHPARQALDDRAMLAEWKPAYKRGFAMQAPLAILGFLLGAWAWYATGQGLWLAGALVLVANWPYTLIVIMPVNHTLMATPIEAADAGTRALVRKWANLHAGRTMLGAAATILFLLALSCGLRTSAASVLSLTQALLCVT
jgi:hypothetical protein